MLQKWIYAGAVFYLGSCSILFKRAIDTCADIAPSCDGEIVVSCVEGFTRREQCEGSCEDGLCLNPDAAFVELVGGKNAIVADDFGLDGSIEILFVNNIFGGAQPTIEVFRVDGQSLTPLPNVIDPASFDGAPTALTVGRFDGDNDPDLALMTRVPGESDHIFFYKAAGDAFIQTTGPIDAGAGSNMILAVDTNQDGVDDIATIEFSGDSTHIERIAMLPGADDPTANGQDFLGLVNSETARFTAADINGDGLVDFAAAIFGGAGAGSVQILSGIDGNTWEPQPPIVTENERSIGIAAADFNQDTQIDLVYTNDLSANVGLLLSDGDELIQAPTISAGGGSNDIITGDLNQDGIADVIVANDQSFDDIPNFGVTILLGRGDGTFHAPIFKFTEFDSLALSLRDVNSDGLQDLLIGGNQGFVVLFLAPKTFLPR